MLSGLNEVSSVATAIETQSGYFSLPLHSMLEPHMLQNFLITLAEELYEVSSSFPDTYIRSDLGTLA